MSPETSPPASKRSIPRPRPAVTSNPQAVRIRSGRHTDVIGQELARRRFRGEVQVLVAVEGHLRWLSADKVLPTAEA